MTNIVRRSCMVIALVAGHSVFFCGGFGGYLALERMKSLHIRPPLLLPTLPKWIEFLRSMRLRLRPTQRAHQLRLRPGAEHVIPAPPLWRREVDQQPLAVAQRRLVNHRAVGIPASRLRSSRAGAARPVRRCVSVVLVAGHAL